MRALYAGCDLHGNSNFLGIIDGEGKRIFKKKLANDLVWIREVLRPFQEELGGGCGGIDLSLVLDGGRTHGGWLQSPFGESGGHSAVFGIKACR